jgi:TonB-dependent SusC/RagA subfamily outer membrane receptor
VKKNSGTFKFKKMRNKILLLGIVIVFSLTYSAAQNKVLHGVVTTFDSIPLVGAEIQVKSTGQEHVTDTLGRFSVPVVQNEVLKFKANGFYNQRVKLEDKTKFLAVNLKMKPGEKNREIAIGYGYVTDREKLNAVAMIDNSDLDFSQYTNIYELIKGRFAGVQVQNGEIIIRGPSSFNSSNAALIVVDGVPSYGNILNTISPNQVRSINVIKDGSSAIYGVRGANGVVLIETKRGGD